jgi:para-aminobenzoate synthetase/4-amino-4-deoxychorismate lyase
MMPASFTLLDDSDASDSQPTSRLYTDLVSELCCSDPATLEHFTGQIQQALHRGLYAVGVFSYEFGVALAGLAVDAKTALPSRALLYRSCRHLSAEQVTDWLQQNGQDDVAGLADLRPGIDEPEFTEAIRRIRQYIADGDTYQVNYTFRFYFKTYGGLCALYQRLRSRQSVPYGALIAMPDGSALLSLSPELFVRHRQGQLHARPMKGTAAAFTGGDDAENARMNAQLGSQLAADEKNRAENLMIVDLLRNDLGRVAVPGSINVPQLFEVTRFNSVLQMTSSVSARLRDDVTLADVLRAIYPCGSITGAPKHRTMQIIQELETSVRGVYTGAIGWFDPSPAKVADFCLSVPIRTLHLQPPSADSSREGVMGVGAGIVYDSVAADEYQECLLKARFLTGLPPQFALFETMFASRELGCRHLDRHLLRLERSARYFGIRFDAKELTRCLDEQCKASSGAAPFRLKLTLDANGEIQIQTGKLEPVEVPVSLLIADHVTDSTDWRLRHKTTLRGNYDQAWTDAERQGAFDMVFFNEAGMLTEGGRSTVLVKFNGCWYTPPLTAGVLPGVMRSVLMDQADWGITEKQITRQELLQAEELAVCNALRGVLAARLIV